MAKPKGKTTNDIYREVTGRIIASLRDGNIPWQRDWVIEGNGLHRSMATKKPYKGINQILLDLTAMYNGYESPFWITYKGAQKQGGHIKKGEKGTTVIYWNMIFVDDPDDPGEKISIPILKHFTVWNLEQCEGIEPHELEVSDYEPEERAKAIIEQFEDAPGIEHDRDEPSYDSGADVVHLPQRNKFDSFEGYFTAAYKELTHSTKHSERLNRLPDVNRPEKERLIGELGAGMLCGAAGIKVAAQFKDRDAYIDSWVEAFEDDHRLIVTCAGKAQKAADYIVGPSEEEEE